MAEQKASSSLTAETLLKKKKVRTKEIDIFLGEEKFTWKFRAISGQRLDDLQSKAPPTKEQRSRGMNFNPERFGPSLVAACSVEPELSLEQAKEIWSSDDWSTGELNTLFNACTDLCMGGFDVPPTVSA